MAYEHKVLRVYVDGMSGVESQVGNLTIFDLKKFGRLIDSYTDDGWELMGPVTSEPSDTLILTLRRKKQQP